MKKIPLLITSFLFVFIGYSQSYDDEVSIIQSIYGMEKREVVSEFVEFTDEQSIEFWSLYDEYEVKRKEIGKQTFELIWNYVSDYGQIKAEDAEMFMSEAIPLRKNSNKLLDKYYKKIKNNLDPVVAVQFYQIEKYISEMIRSEIIEELFITKEE